MAIDIRTGDIVRADPIKKLYKVVYSLNPYMEKYAVPIGSMHTIPNTSGVVMSTAYAVGDHVLYLCPDQDTARDNPVVWILGRVPKDITYTDEYTSSPARDLLFPRLKKLTSDLYPALTDLLQDDGFVDSTYSARENFPYDVATGDYSIIGENTRLNIGDYNIILGAGESELFVDSLLGVITQSSNLYNRYTIGESTRTQCYRGNLVYTKKLTGSIEQGKLPINKAIFPYREQFSDLIYGHRAEILDSANRPISQIHKGLDGSLSIKTVGKLSLQRTVYMDNMALSVEEAVSSGDPLDVPTVVDPVAPIKELPDWLGDKLIDGTDDIINTMLRAPSEDEWETPEGTETVTYKDYYTNTDRKVSKAASGLFLEDDGTVVIRDAWGSEFRMGHGNVQIAASNNMTTIAGRDNLTIVSGVHAVTANNGLEFGVSAGDIAIHTKEGIRLGCNELSTSANKVIEAVDDTKVCKYKHVYTEAENSSARVTNSAEIITNNIQISGENSLTLSSRACGMTLTANAITMGASAVTVHSSIIADRGDFTLDVGGLDYKRRTITCSPSQVSLLVSGHIQAGESIFSNGSIQSAAGVYANTMAAHNVTSLGGIYKLRSRIKENNALDSRNTFKVYSGFTEDVANAIKLLLKEGTTNIKRIFRMSSKAFKIINPIFSVLRGRYKISPAACSTSSGEVSYIYPGKQFWEKDGLVSISSDIDPKTERKITVTGCAGLMLNVPNNKKEAGK